MRYSKSHQEDTRRKLIQAAASLLLAGGLRGVSIDRVAAAAGLTHGAVYKHFPSKEALLLAALGQAGAVFRRTLADRGSTSDQLFDWYLSPDHLGGSVGGCVVAATAGDAPLADPAIRAEFEAEFRALVRLFNDNVVPDDMAFARAALAVGGVTLARGVNDPALADRLLAACRRLARRNPVMPSRPPRFSPMPRLSAEDRLPRRRVAIPGAEISYVDVGAGPTIVFIHGTHAFSYAWRHVMPLFAQNYRCLAPDLVGMGHSGPAADGSYRFFDQVRYIEQWLDAVGWEENLILVGHEWGASICFDLAARHPGRVSAVVHLGGLLGHGTLAMFPRAIAALHQQLRAPGGDALILRDNILFEKVIRRSTLRRLSDVEIETYGARWREPDADRKPLLDLTLDMPLDGEPADIYAHLQWVGEMMAASPIPKLYIRGVPGWRRLDPDAGLFREWRNQSAVDIPGIHLLMEDAPMEIAASINDFLQSAKLSLSRSNRPISIAG